MSTGTHRTIRGIDDDLWQAAQAVAEQRGTTVSEEIRRFLRRYVARARRPA